MDNGKDLLLLLTAISTEEQLFDELKEAVTTFGITKTEEARHKLHMMCIIFASKKLVGNDIDGALKGIKRLDELEARDKAFQTTKN